MSTRSKAQGAECVTVREGEDSGQRGCLRVQGVLARRAATTGAALEESEIVGEDYGSTHDFGEIGG